MPDENSACVLLIRCHRRSQQRFVLPSFPEPAAKGCFPTGGRWIGGRRGHRSDDEFGNHGRQSGHLFRCGRQRCPERSGYPDRVSSPLRRAEVEPRRDRSSRQR